MSKVIQVLRKQCGKIGGANISMKVPDSAYDLLKDYKIEIIDYKIQKEETTIFLCKDGEDVDSVTFNPKLPNCFADAMKTITEKLAENKPKKKLT